MTDETPTPRQRAEEARQRYEQVYADRASKYVDQAANPDGWAELREILKRFDSMYYTLYNDPGEGVVYGSQFLDNAEMARDGGYYLCCTKCGQGMNDVDEDEELHEDGCPNRGANPMGDMIEMLSERLGPEKAAEMLANALNPDPAPADDDESEVTS